MAKNQNVTKKLHQKKSRANKIPTRREISLALSAIEARDPKSVRMLKSAFSKETFRKTICFTGPAGVGKSSLISSLLRLASPTKRIAWLACDPSSEVSGGSVLGDRIRLSGIELNDAIFVRSLSTRSARAFSPAIRDMEVYLEQFFDEVWVETAGSGQTQQEVAGISGLTILVLQPETGDDIQWMKSGVRELSDLFVVHKADLKGSELMAQSLIESGVNKSRLCLASAKTGNGLSELLDLIKKTQASMAWKHRLSALHLAHARDIYFERSLRDVEKSFEKKKRALLQNPYL